MKNQIIAILVLSLLLSVLIPILAPEKGQADFKAYWSTAALFVHGGNPYNPNEMLEIQNEAAGLQEGTEAVLNAWNPPWLILLLAPLGFLSFHLAIKVWLFINLLMIGNALILTWDLYSVRNDIRGFQYIMLASFFYIPTIFTIAMGQISGLVLVGIILCLSWLNKNQDWFSGAALLVTMIKPHLSYFFILLVLVWIIKNRRWKIIGGMVSFAAVTTLIFSIILPDWPKDYFSLILSMPFTQIYTSTVGSFMDVIFGTKLFYFSAVIVLFLLNPVHALTRSEEWLVPANFSLLIGVPFSPYGFLFDQIVLLPSIIHIIVWIRTKQIRGINALLISLSLMLINVGLLVLATAQGGQGYFMFTWAPLVLLVTYFLAWKIKSEPSA